MREKLIELINEAEDYATDTCILTSECIDCPGRKYGNECRDYLKVDYLIANGVTFGEDKNVLNKKIAALEKSNRNWRRKIQKIRQRYAKQEVPTNADRCVCCGAIIPEGSMVCPNCHGEKEGATDGK